MSKRASFDEEWQTLQFSTLWAMHIATMAGDDYIDDRETDVWARYVTYPDTVSGALTHEVMAQIKNDMNG